MDKKSLSNACLLTSVLISTALLNRGIRNQVTVGYITMSKLFTIRHVWVHILPNSLKTCPETENFIADLSIVTRSGLHVEYQLLLPNGADLLDKDEDNKEEHELLESTLDKVCKHAGSTRIVVDYGTVIKSAVEAQPLWVDIVDMLLK